MKVTDAISEYVQQRQAAGSPFVSNKAKLEEFSRYCGEICLTDLTAERISEFLNASRCSISATRHPERRRAEPPAATVLGLLGADPERAATREEIYKVLTCSARNVALPADTFKRNGRLQDGSVQTTPMV